MLVIAVRNSAVKSGESYAVKVAWFGFQATNVRDDPSCIADGLLEVENAVVPFSIILMSPPREPPVPATKTSITAAVMLFRSPGTSPSVIWNRQPIVLASAVFTCWSA